MNVGGAVEVPGRRRRVGTSPFGDALIVFVFLAGLLFSLRATFALGDAPLPNDDALVLGRLDTAVADVRRRVTGTLVWRTVREGEPVFAGDALFVGDESSARVSLRRGGVIDIDARSLVVLSAPEENLRPQLEVRRGGASADGVSDEIAWRAGSSAVTFAPGTRGRVRLDNDANLRLEVDSGAAQGHTAAGALSVGAGEGVRIDSEGKVERQRLNISLREPAEGAQLFVKADTPITFRWNAGVPRAHLVIGADPTLTRPELSLDADGAELVVPGLLPGVYFWAVFGPEGERSAVRKLVIAKDKAPTLLSPRPEEVVDLSRQTTLGLSWVPVPAAAAYRLELAAEGDFATPLLRASTSMSGYVHPGQSLPEGRYCFRVLAERQGLADPPWSETHCFRVVLRPVLRAPRLFGPDVLPESDAQGEQGFWLDGLYRLLLGGVARAAETPDAGNDVVLRWEAIPGAAGYVVEVSETVDFRAPLIREKVQTPLLRFRAPARRDYLWRVRAIDEIGREGEVSPAQRLALAVPAPTMVLPRDGTTLWLSDSEAKAGASATLEVQLSAVRSGLVAVIEWSDDEGFARLSGRHSLDGATTWRTALPPGKTFWRLRSVAPDGYEGEPGPSRKVLVRVRPPPPPPKVEAPPVVAVVGPSGSAGRHTSESGGHGASSGTAAGEVDGEASRRDGADPVTAASDASSDPGSQAGGASTVGAADPSGGEGRAAMSRIWVGPSVGVLGPVGGAALARVGLEGLMRLDAWGWPLETGLAVGYLSAGSELRDSLGTRRATGRLHAVPLEWVGRYMVHLPPIDAAIGIGLGTMLATVVVRAPGQPEERATQATFTGRVSATVLVPIPRGRLAATLSALGDTGVGGLGRFRGTGVELSLAYHLAAY